MTVGWAFFSFYPITVFPILKAPQWTTGFTVNIVFIICYWALFLLGQYLWRREEARKKYDINVHAPGCASDEELKGESTVHVEQVDKESR